MKPNVGGMNGWIRFFAGMVIIGAGIFFKSWWGAIGVLPLLTGLFKFCPAYTLLGCSTACKPKQEPPA